MNLPEAVNHLSDLHGIKIKSPFILPSSQGEVVFDCLIIGYGTKNGMIINKKWSTIEGIQEELINLGYGFSCFDIRSCSEGIEECLDDWKKV